VENKYQLLHSTYWCAKDKSEDCVNAILKNVETNEVKLELIKNPKRQIGITKKGLQPTLNSKKIYEDFDNLDIYTIHNKDLRDELQKKLKGHNYGYTSLKQLMNTPFVFGADIDINVLIKQHYLNNCDKPITSFRVGGFDIETSVTGGKEIIAVTYVSPELKVYTAVLESFIKTTSIGEINTYFDKCILEFQNKVNPETKVIIDKLKNETIPGGIEFTITSHKTEVDLLKWIFTCIHKDKPEFISIWNMGFDIPYVLDRLSVHNTFPHKILCHPEVPYKYRVCKYKPDRNPNVSHFTHKWDVFELSGYSQFYDSMCLYSRLRQHDGIEDSYKLQHIAEKIVGTGKLEHDNAGHYLMQTTKQKEYVVYNVIDSLIITLLEKRVNDISSMMMLLKDTSIDSFHHQTVQLKNWFYNYCKQNNKLPASWHGRILHETDEQISNVGGNVLAPGLAWRTGVNKITELLECSDNIISKLNILVSDIDVALA
jgi:hypothetical protein